MGASEPIAIVAVGAAVGELRLPVTEIGAAWGRRGSGQVAVAAPDEDTLTLAWAAADDALGAADVQRPDGLWWGTTRPPFAEGPSWAYLATALGFTPDAAGALFAGSPHAGIEALEAAVDALAAGRVDTALVVTSDAVLPGLGSGVETSAAAGAAAVVLQRAAAPAVITRRSTHAEPFLDRYRGDREDETREVYDGRLFREEIFLPVTSTAAAQLDAGDAKWSLPDPDGRLGSALAKRMGVSEVVSAAHRASLGDLGAAAPLAGLVTAFCSPGPAAAMGYGGGRATAVAIDVTAPVPGASTATAALDAVGTPTTYGAVLRSRGQLVASGEQVEMAVPPGSAMFVRDNHDVLALIGARCVSCETVNFPPAVHPSCTGCGGDKFTEHALARTGTVQTFVINHTMPAPFVAPLPLVCVDLDDGSRLMLQGTGDGAALAIGDPARLVLRRYTIERGVPVYGWKVAPPRPASESNEASDV